MADESHETLARPPLSCNGNNGDHCCWVDGNVCEKLDLSDPLVPRCSLLTELGSWDAVHESEEWKALPVAEWFGEMCPGFGCGDWPEKIPDVMDQPTGKCCWQMSLAGKA